MGATAFRTRKSSRGQYKVRKAARLNGKIPASRSHEPRPWWCGSLSIQETEAKIAKDAVKLPTFREIEAQRQAEAFEAFKERFKAKNSIALAA